MKEREMKFHQRKEKNVCIKFEEPKIHHAKRNTRFI